MQGRAIHWAAGAVFAFLAGACTKDEPVAGSRLKARLQVVASLESAGEQLDVVASYQRLSGPLVPLASARLAVSGPGQLNVPLELDITACLADAQRATPAGGCPVVVDAVLRDAAGAALDSARVGPFDVGSGSTVSPPAAIRLQAAANLVAESGDGQLAWVGGTLQLPVVLRLTDRAGAPIGGRVVTVTVQSGGGSVVGGPFVTDLTGRVSVGYRVGSTVGANAARASVALGSATLSRSLAFTTIVVRRDRVAVGGFHSCAIFQNGTTRCWGSNDDGGIGNRLVATPGDTLFPVAVAGSPSFVALASSNANNIYAGQTCGLTTAGAILCWGLSTTNELGLSGSDTCLPFGQSLPCTKEPQQVSGNLTFATVDVGGAGQPGAGNNRFPARVCGVAVNGDAYCWGENARGAIGDGTTTPRTSPTRVGVGEKWIDLTTGQRQTCGVTVKGEAFCWGDNQLGGMGTGDTLSSLVPRRVLTTERFRSIDAGSINACALTLAGLARCWGLGGNNGVEDALAPDTGATLSATQLSVGLQHACGVTATGTGICGGSNLNGVLGDGSPPTNVPAPNANPVTVRGSVAFAGIIAGVLQTCALSVAGDPYCWGSGNRGEVGAGSRGVFSVPTRVALGPVTPSAPAVMLPFTAIPTFWPPGLGCPNNPGVPSLGVQVLDANGYKIPGAVVQFFARTPGASVTTASAITNGNGVAFSNCTMAPTVGPSVFVARSPLIANDSVVYRSIGTIVGPPARVSCISCLNITGIVGSTATLQTPGGLPFVVVADSLGLPVAGVAVAYSKPSPSGASFAPSLPATILTNAFGAAFLTSWRIDTIARLDTVVALVAGFPGLVQTLRISGLPDTPTGVIFSNHPQLTARVGQLIAPVTVTLRDRYGNVATNAASRVVTMTRIGGDSASVLSGTLTVNTVNGVATFNNLRINLVGSQYRLVASVAGFPPGFSTVFDVIP